MAGGITETLKQTAPNVYDRHHHERVRLEVVADASKTPKTLVMTDKNRGCRWDGTPNNPSLHQKRARTPCSH